VTELKPAADGTFEIPAMPVVPIRLPLIVRGEELRPQLKKGAALVVQKEADHATADAEPAYYLVKHGQDTYRVGSRIAMAFIRDGDVRQIGADHKGRLMYIITMKGHS
jgi:hypothetical protein